MISTIFYIFSLLLTQLPVKTFCQTTTTASPPVRRSLTESSCSHGINPNGTTPRTFPLASGLLHILTWMKINCDGQITAVTFMNRQTASATTRFYIAVFEAIPLQRSTVAYRLVNFVPIQLQSFDQGWQTVNLPETATMAVQMGQFLGYFYDRWDLPQNALIVPYRLGVSDAETGQYKTYVGFQSLAELRDIKELKAPGELQPNPSGRIVALNVTITKRLTVATCGEALTIPQGFVKERSSNGQLKAGDYVIYGCLDGYALQGALYSHCQADGTWTTLPVCMPTCGADPSIPYAQVQYKSFEKASRLGDTVDYVCLPGYRLSEESNRRIVCQEGSRWSAAPLCVLNQTAITTPSPVQSSTLTARISCGSAPSIELASVVSRNFEGSNSAPLSEVRYECQTGYEFSGGSGLVICGYDGFWGNLPFCIQNGAVDRPAATDTSNEITCGNPPAILNGDFVSASYSIQNPARKNDTVTYACNGGYTIRGNRVVTCGEDGTWSVRPSCELLVVVTTRAPPRCGQPPQIRNGQVLRISDDLLQAIYACNEGFRILGAEVVTCTGAAWSSIPSCETLTSRATATTPSNLDYGEAEPLLASICGQYPTVRNAREVSREDLNPGRDGGELVRFECLEPYVMEGAETVLCQTRPLGWSAVPTCVAARSCGTAPLVENAVVDYQDFEGSASRSGSQVRYRCLGAYTISQQDTARCDGVSGNWFQLPSCSFQTCGQPPNIDNGRVETQSFSGASSIAGSTVTYACSTGLTMTGSNTITCDPETLQWTRGPMCQSSGQSGSNTVTSCGLPPGVKNGAITFNSIRNQAQNGDYVFYQCDEGFSLVGVNYVTCEANRWSRPPQCVSSCGSNGPTIFGAQIVSRSFQDYALTGDTVAYRCLPGFAFAQGSVTEIRCLPTLRWSIPFPNCQADRQSGNPSLVPTVAPATTPQPSTCGNPPQITNARVQQTFPKAVRYTCIEGYVIKDFDTAACQSDNTWSPIPECIVSCGGAPAVANALITFRSFNGASSQPSSVIRYACESGQPISGQDTVICGDNGRWSALPSCVTCGLPPVVDKARVDYQNFVGDASVPSSTARYACQLGQQVKGSDTVICGSDGRWSLAPQCTPNSCGVPPQVQNGVILSKSYQGTNGGPNDQVIYGCRTDQGFFALKGLATVTCNFQTLQWSQAPTCEGDITSCGRVPELENGFVAASSVPTGEISTGNDFVFFSCNVGYVLNGKDLVECKNSRWTDRPNCIASCGLNGPGVPNAVVAKRSFRTFAVVGDTVEYSCSEGFRLSLDSRSTITCLNTWRWTQLPLCVPVSDTTTTPKPEAQRNPVSKCGTAPTLRDGYITKQTFADNTTVFLDSVEYSCNETFRMLGLNIIFCQSNNLWSTPPQCNPIQAVQTTARPASTVCPTPPQTIANGRLLSQDFEARPSSGALITYRCNRGFIMSGANRVQCANGAWSTLPSCLPDRRSGNSLPAMCDHPPTLPNGRVDQTNIGTSGQLELGDYVVYACSSGFELQGNARVWCEGSVEAVAWTNPPTCRISRTPLTTTPNPNLCGRAPDVENANKVRFLYQGSEWGTSLASPGDKVYYQCFEGYVLVGSENGVAECVAGSPTASWQNVPTCSGKTCGPLPILANGRLATAIYKSGNSRFGGPGDTLYYACSTGFSLVGPETVTCSGNEQSRSWSVLPRCLRVDSVDDMALNFPAQGGTVINADPVTQLTRTSPRPTIVSVLNSDVSMSDPKDFCGPLAEVANAYLVTAISPNLRQYALGTILQYNCNSGFQLDSSTIDTVICTPEGWSKPPICSRNLRAIDFSPCRAPPVVENGFISAINATFQVTYTCKLGYGAADPSKLNVFCSRANGTWSAVPSCIPAGCGPAPLVTNARLTVKTFDLSSIPDDKAFYQCETGFQVRNSAYVVISCQANGEWSQLGQCDPTEGLQGLPVLQTDRETCGPTPNLENGRVIFTQFITGTQLRAGLGDTVFYSCNEGYALTGDRQVVCSSSPLKWSTMPSCVRSNLCASYPVVTNGFVVTQNVGTQVAAVGDSLTFQCIEGFRLDGAAQVTCGNQGWSLLPRCVRQAASTCNRPPAIENGVIAYSDFAGNQSVPGSKTFYRCNENFVINVVPSSVTCLETGSWSTPPRCVRTSTVTQSVRCQALPNLANGQILFKSYETTPQVGSLVMFDCSEGYTLATRQNYVQCAADGSWTDTPRCERRIGCGAIPSIPNGRVSGKTFASDVATVDDRVFYSCNAGFSLVGTIAYTVCQNGTWSTLPACTSQSATCGDLPSVENSRIVYKSQKGDVPMEGDVLWLSCLAGYNLIGSEVVKCQADGTWSELPSCSASAGTNCAPPPTVDNAAIYFRSYTENSAPITGDYVRYRCNDGFSRTTATDESTCSGAGTWTQLPQCRPSGTVSGCGLAPTVENSRVAFTTILGGGQGVTNDIVWFECLTGFEIEGSSAVRCLPTGLWTPSPRCRYTVTDTCGAPPPVNKGFISQPYHGPSITGSSVVYACSTGFKLFGSPTVTCQASGKWSTTPRCESVSSQVSCGAAPSIDNGRTIEVNFQNNASDVTSYAIYGCNSGFVLRGNTRIECLGSGGWTTPPTCQARPTTGTTCGAVPNVANAVVVYNTVPANSNFSIVGDIVWYQCLEGYQPSSYPGIQCSSKGSWSGLPNCAAIKRFRCSSAMSLLFALDLQESDGFSRTELASIVSFLKSIPSNYRKITDMKGATTPDTTSFSTGAVTLTSITVARSYVSKLLTVEDGQNNDAPMAEWNEWLDANVAEFKHALNDDLAKLLQTIRTTLVPALPIQSPNYNTSLRVVYLTTARRGTSLIEAQGEATALQLMGGRIFVFAVGDALSALTQQTALRQQVATDTSYFRYFSTARQMTVDALSSDASFLNFFCGPK